jgi:hypothetical protein
MSRRNGFVGLLVAAATLAVVAGAVSGAGGEDSAKPLSRADYQAALYPILEDASGPTRTYGKLVVGPSSRVRCSRLMNRFSHQVDSLVDRVTVLRPPADAAPVQRDFLRAARTSLARVRTIRTAVAKGELRCGRPLNHRLYGMPSTARAAAAMTELENRGYHLGLG